MFSRTGAPQKRPPQARLRCWTAEGPPYGVLVPHDIAWPVYVRLPDSEFRIRVIATKLRTVVIAIFMVSLYIHVRKLMIIFISQTEPPYF